MNLKIDYNKIWGYIVKNIILYTSVILFYSVLIYKYKEDIELKEKPPKYNIDFLDCLYCVTYSLCLVNFGEAIPLTWEINMLFYSIFLLSWVLVLVWIYDLYGFFFN